MCRVSLDIVALPLFTSYGGVVYEPRGIRISRCVFKYCCGVEFPSILRKFAGGCRGCAPPPPPPQMTCGFLIQLVFCKKKTMGFIGVEVEQETSAPPPKKILDPPLILAKGDTLLG